jgi:hypothetical protein
MFGIYSLAPIDAEAKWTLQIARLARTAAGWVSVPLDCGRAMQLNTCLRASEFDAPTSPSADGLLLAEDGNDIGTAWLGPVCPAARSRYLCPP